VVLIESTKPIVPLMPLIHPTALVDPQAQLDSSVTVGAYSVIGPHVRIGAGSSIGPHCTIEGHTHIGVDNRVFQFCSLGAVPQDKKYANEPTELHLGDRNTIREFCTFNLGTVQDGGVTRLGSDNWIMAYVHIAHDCHIGNQVIIANATQLGGHVHVGDWAFLGGLCGVHQFVRVGAHAMTGFQTRLSQDLPPFCTASGNPVQVQGTNQEGLRRRGFSPERMAGIKHMHRLLYRQSLTLAAAQQAIQALAAQSDPQAQDATVMLEFLAAAARGIVR
jgi:UDP-N-acetylglucosamine acyltransferase